MTARTVVIGLDGAAFDLFVPWVEQGKLPNLKRLLEQGARAVSQSCLPPTTSPSWKCYSTGKNPGKIGIFWWENIDRKARRVVLPPVDRVNLQDEIWDYMGRAGKKVGVMNMPLTFPPKKVNGFMVSGPPTGQTDGFCYPAELEARLKAEFGYSVYPKGYAQAKGNPDKMAECICSLIETKFRTARALAHEHNLDFLHLTIFYINSLQHDYWDDAPTLAAWQTVDRQLAPLLDDGCNIFIISDHGCNEIKQVCHINTWLAEQGYLKTTAAMKATSLLYRLGISRTRANHIARTLHLRWLGRLVPEKALDIMPSASGSADETRKNDKIEWQASQALASGQGPVYILDTAGDPDSLRQELRRKLEQLSNPKTGAKVAQHVYLREEAYSGEFLADAPDLIIDPAPGTHIRGGITVSSKAVFEQPSGWRGENKRDGILVAYGPDIRPGFDLGRVSILDIAPTILHLMDIPVPTDMDGRVLTEIFREGSAPARRPLRDQPGQDSRTRMEKERISRGLRRLGAKSRAGGGAPIP